MTLKIWLGITIVMREFMPFILLASSLVAGFGAAYQLDERSIGCGLAVVMPIIIAGSVLAHPIADGWYDIGSICLFVLVAVSGAYGYDYLMQLSGPQNTRFAGGMLGVCGSSLLIIVLLMACCRFARTASGRPH